FHSRTRRTVPEPGRRGGRAGRSRRERVVHRGRDESLLLRDLHSHRRLDRDDVHPGAASQDHHRRTGTRALIEAQRAGASMTWQAAHQPHGGGSAMPSPRLSQAPSSTTTPRTRTVGRHLARGFVLLVLLVALAACTTAPPPPPPPDQDDIVLLVANYSDNRVEVMGAETDAADLVARPADSFVDTGAASTVHAVWGPDDRIYVSDFALNQIRVYDADAVLGSAAPATIAVITSPDLLEPYALAF